MKWTLVILLSSILTGHQLQGCSVGAKVGETAILPVKVNLTEDSNLTRHTIVWKNERGGIVHDYWYVDDNNEYQDEHFKNRTSLFSREEIEKGNFSLKISNVTKNDEGNYTCKVYIVDNKTYKVSLCVLKISEHKGSTQSPGLTTGGISGIVTAVLIILTAALIGVAVFLFYKRRADNEDQHYQQGQRQIALQDRDGGGGREGDGGRDEEDGGAGAGEDPEEPGEGSAMITPPAGNDDS